MTLGRSGRPAVRLFTDACVGGDAENGFVSRGLSSLEALPVAGTQESRSGKRAVMGLSFDAVFEAEFAPLYRYLRRRVGPDLAQDLAAATFGTAYAKWDRFDQTRPVRPWIYGIAANLVRHHWRGERRMLRAYQRTGVDPVIGPEDEAISRLDASAQRRQLAAALADLRPQEREILLLHAWADLSDGEIAAALSLPVGTVKSRLHRTRERLRNRLDPNGQAQVKTVIARPEDR